MYESGTRLQERITNLASRPRRRRAAQRNRSSSEPERHRPRPPRARPPVAVGARRGHRPDAQRDPRAGRRAGRRGARHRGRRGPPRARRAGPRRSSASNPHGAVVLSLEILVDSIAAAIVGLGGETLEHVRRRPAARRAVGRRRRGGPARPSRPSSGPAATGRSSASASRSPASCGAVDGLVSMAPNLGWVDVPLGGAPRARARPSRSRSASSTTPTRASSASTGAARRSASTTSLYVSGEVGVGGGLIVDGAPADGRRRVRRRDRPRDRQPRRRRLPLRLAWAAGRRRSARASCSRWPVIRPTRVAPASTPSCGRPRRAPRPRSRPSRTSGAGWASGSAGLVNILNPRLVILGGPNSRLYPLVRDAIDAELTRVRAAGRRGRSSASSRRRSGSTRRSSARPRWPSIPCCPIRRPGSAAATPPSTWRPPDGDSPDPSSTSASPGNRRLA